jgi:hypothetical protein
MRLGEGGIDGEVSAKLPSFAARHVERCLVDALAILGGGEGRNWKFGTTCSGCGCLIHGTKFSLNKIILFEKLKLQAPLTKEGLRLSLGTKMF